MEIGHSRLLKFFVENKPKMEQHSMKIENMAPSDIESEVPRQQKLREASTEPTVEPVQNETIEWIDLRDMIKKPVYMGLQEEVIRTQRIRPPRAEEGPKDVPVKTSPEENKPQTRIPVSRFKPLAERVLRERRDATDANGQKSRREAPEKPRRTTIPKPIHKTAIVKKNPTVDGQTVKLENEPVIEARDETLVKTNERRAIRRDKIPVMRKDHYKIIKKSNNGDENKDTSDDRSIDHEHGESAKTDPNAKLDDDFDKLYDEIVDNDVASLPDEILETKVKDPEKLESKFEEIVHQYDDVTVEQVKIEPVDKARYSRIPLLRRRSLHDVKVPGQLERRLSLKTNNINKSVGVRTEEMSESKLEEKDDTQQNGIKGGMRPARVNSDDENPDDFVEINKNDDNEDLYIAADSPHRIPDYNTISTPDSELVKVSILGLSARDIPLHENQNIATPEFETVKVAVIDIPAEDASSCVDKDLETVDAKPRHVTEIQDDTFKDESEGIEDNLNSYDNNDIAIQNKIEEDPINNVNDEKETIQDDTFKDDSEGNEDNVNSYHNNDIAIQNKIEEDPINNENDEKETKDYEPNHKNIPQQNIPILSPDEELKSFGLLKSANTIEERTKSRYINKPQNEKPNNNDVATLDEDIPIVKGNVNRILKRLTSQEHPNDVNTHINNDKEVIEVKEDVANIPKKKSVLSKIALFERAEIEPPFPKKPIHRYSKPKRTISEEIKHSPKIVQEVLKPKGTEQIDRHTIVTVDITKPIEVITNNEEQVTIVDNFKEEEITYDNFDDARQNKIERVDIELNDPSIMDENETVSIDRTIHDDYNKVEIIDVSQGTNKDHITTLENKLNFNHDHNVRTVHGKETNKNKLDNIDKVEKWKSTDALANFVPVKEKIHRLKSYEDTINMKKAKSTAELDLGDAIKGKVKNMIVRMNSSELLDEVTQKQKEVEVISVKERPRKRSVSEKIALFERKLTPVAMETVKPQTPRALDIDSKPVNDTVNSIQQVTSEEYAAKIQELVNAKTKYGSANMSYVQLKDGRNMPVLALGTALLDPRLAKHIVSAAIDLGFRAIDTAFIYGNEREVGEGIRAKIQDGTVRREELFIMSKLWSTFHRPDLVETACRASLAATGLEYFDLFMIHNPMSFKEGGDPLPKIANVIQFSEYDYLDAWYAMEDLVPKGLVKSIGVSNFNSAQLTRVLEKGRVKPVVNQVECHPYLSQQRLSDFCEARDVRMSCFGVLGSKGTPAELKATQTAAIDDPLVQIMAAGLSISPAQLLIRYQIDSGRTVVVKASKPAHLWDNLLALNVTLDPIHLTALHAVNKNQRAFTFTGMGDTHRNYPFKIPF